MIGHSVILGERFDDAILTVTEALADQGFGVITRIDMHKTFAEKLVSIFVIIPSLALAIPVSPTKPCRTTRRWAFFCRAT